MSRRRRMLFYIRFADRDNAVRGFGILIRSKQQSAQFKGGIFRVTREHINLLRNAGVSFDYA